MNDPAKIDKEVEAIKAITMSLSELDENKQKLVLRYVIEHLGIQKDFVLSSATPSDPELPRVPPPPPPLENPPPPIKNIRSLKEEKNPSSDIQMAVLVAYYLSEHAPVEERKDQISSSDIDKYFKQAGHPPPVKPSNTLFNAKNAGYLENVATGQFKLNAVGYNLVVHNLPKTGNSMVLKARKIKRKEKVPRRKKIKRKVGKNAQ